MRDLAHFLFPAPRQDRTDDEDELCMWNVSCRRNVCGTSRNVSYVCVTSRAAAGSHPEAAEMAKKMASEGGLLGLALAGKTRGGTLGDLMGQSGAGRSGSSVLGQGESLGLGGGEREAEGKEAGEKKADDKKKVCVGLGFGI